MRQAPVTHAALTLWMHLVRIRLISLHGLSDAEVSVLWHHNQRLFLLAKHMLCEDAMDSALRAECVSRAYNDGIHSEYRLV